LKQRPVLWYHLGFLIEGLLLQMAAANEVAGFTNWFENRSAILLTAYKRIGLSNIPQTMDKVLQSKHVYVANLIQDLERLNISIPRFKDMTRIRNMKSLRTVGSILDYKGHEVVYRLNIIGLQKAAMSEECSVEMGSHLYISIEAGIISIISELAF
jgi:hypothetical protein